MRLPCLLVLALLAGCSAPTDIADPEPTGPSPPATAPTEGDVAPQPPAPAANASSPPAAGNGSAEAGPEPAAEPPADVRMSGSKDLLLESHREVLEFTAPAGARTGYVNAWMQGMESPLMAPGTACYQVRATALDGSFESVWGSGPCTTAVTLLPPVTGEDGFRYGGKGIISWDARDLCECSYEILLLAGRQANTLVWDVVIDYEGPESSS